jgi:hypothetical protein
MSNTTTNEFDAMVGAIMTPAGVTFRFNSGKETNCSNEEAREIIGKRIFNRIEENYGSWIEM